MQMSGGEERATQRLAPEHFPPNKAMIFLAECSQKQGEGASLASKAKSCLIQ
jgi:hypothetical protein